MKATDVLERKVTRRGFLQGVGGLTFAIGAGGMLRAVAQTSGNDELAPNLWVNIGADDTITIQFGGTELGQGTMTALPLVLAEELDADWDRVRVEQVATHDPDYGNPRAFRYLGEGILYTAGSQTLRGYYEAMRQAGAQARKVLLDAAASEWGVAASELETEPSVVVHPGSGRRMSYGEIASFAEAPENIEPVDESEFKDRSEYRYVGTDVLRIDVEAKSDGSAVFGIDVQVPGMVYASVLRAPVEGERPLTVESAAALAIPGVLEIVEMPWGVAVVAETVEASLAGKDALDVSWSHESRFREVDSDAVLAEYEAYARDTAYSTDDTPLWQDVGDIDAALAGADRVIEATYVTDAAYHAQMEPMNATASVSADGKSAEIWVSTQSQSMAVMGAAEALDTTIDKITLHLPYVGGAFGRRTEYRQKDIDDALFVSRQIGRPVKVIWSREDDVRDGTFRPLAAQFLRGGLDADGRIVAVHQRVAAPSVLEYMNPPRWATARGRDGIAMNGAQETRYAIPNLRAEHVRMERCSRVLAWRGVASSYTRFANESFIDELAHESGADPLEFRLDLARNDPRGRAVLEEAGRLAEWTRQRDDTALGVALSDYGGASVAAGIAEVSVDEATGDIAVHRFWMVVDAGLIVAPRNTEAQLEGNVIYGLSNALRERISIKEGVVEQSNFHDYPVMRMNEVPDIMVKALASDAPPSGIGELGLATTGAAVANAVFRATGARVRALPFTRERVLAALQEV